MKRKLKEMKKASILLLLAMFAISSCTEDLDITPRDDDSVLTDDAFENEEAYKQLLAGVYAGFATTSTEGAFESNLSGIDAGTSQFGRVLLYMQTLAADQMIWSYENDAGTREIQRNIWTAQNPLIIGMFSRTMNNIAFANNFLQETTPEKLDARNVSDATRAEIVTYRAEARLLRAMNYYYMMDLFGKANFVTEDTESGVAAETPVANRAELFSFIESELLEIENDLVDANQNEYGRADKGVAYMVLAKIYLNAEVYIGENRYADCLSYCERILGAGYTLAPSYLHNFMADNNTNDAAKEIIFPIIADGETTQSFGPTTTMINGSVGSIEQNGEEVGVAREGWGGALRVRRQFAELFTTGQFSTDERNTLIIGDRPIDIESIANRDSGYIIQKYSNATSTGGFGIDLTFVDTDFPLYRLADVHLMYAEAHLRGGGGALATAVDLINDLRERANNPNLISAGDLTLDFILDERSRELHWEAHRRQDLIRFNRYTGGNYNWAWKGNGTNGISIPSHFDLYPIPNFNLSSNPNLTQNPGY